jgi:hypothetical protein
MEYIGTLKLSGAYGASRTRAPVRFEVDVQPQGRGESNNPSEAPVSIPELTALINRRRLRSEFIGEDLFADPAWDILLELYLASLRQHRISVSSLCVGLVPATTTLRWLAALSKWGMIERRDDPFDGRRALLNLSESGRRTMDAYFKRVQP